MEVRYNILGCRGFGRMDKLPSGANSLAGMADRAFYVACSDILRNRRGSCFAFLF